MICSFCKNIICGKKYCFFCGSKLEFKILVLCASDNSTTINKSLNKILPLFNKNLDLKSKLIKFIYIGYNITENNNNKFKIDLSRINEEQYSILYKNGPFDLVINEYCSNFVKGDFNTNTIIDILNTFFLKKITKNNHFYITPNYKNILTIYDKDNNFIIPGYNNIDKQGKLLLSIKI